MLNAETALGLDLHGDVNLPSHPDSSVALLAEHALLGLQTCAFYSVISLYKSTTQFNHS